LFVQSERTPDRAAGGLGIGLTIVERLVRMHGGEVRAHSDGPGRGSSFVLRLPRAPAAAETPAPTPPVDAATVVAVHRVLVAEDHVDFAASLEFLLRRWGYEVRVTRDGHEALAAARADPPEVALLDLGLPGLDGYALAAALRRELDGTIGLVALSGYGQPEDVRRAREAGFDEHLTK